MDGGDDSSRSTPGGYGSHDAAPPAWNYIYRQTGQIDEESFSPTEGHPCREATTLFQTGPFNGAALGHDQSTWSASEHEQSASSASDEHTKYHSEPTGRSPVPQPSYFAIQVERASHNEIEPQSTAPSSTYPALPAMFSFDDNPHFGHVERPLGPIGADLELSGMHGNNEENMVSNPPMPQGDDLFDEKLLLDDVNHYVQPVHKQPWSPYIPRDYPESPYLAESESIAPNGPVSSTPAQSRSLSSRSDIQSPTTSMSTDPRANVMSSSMATLTPDNQNQTYGFIISTTEDIAPRCELPFGTSNGLNADSYNLDCFVQAPAQGCGQPGYIHPDRVTYSR
jgi:hypothetical protein